MARPKLVAVNGSNSFVHPDSLHKTLKVAATHEIVFTNEKSLNSYRHMLYSVNKQGEHKYRTLRAEDHPYALILWRMK